MFVTIVVQCEVQTEKEAGRKISTLFMDIRGAFDHVAKNQLLAVMSRLGLPLSLLTWVDSFLSDQKLKLAFDGKEEEFSSVKTGIPQSSPISPILFLIYVRDMFSSRTGKFISYIDDIALTVSSNSFEKNTRVLEREYKNLQ